MFGLVKGFDLGQIVGQDGYELCATVRYETQNFMNGEPVKSASSPRSAANFVATL